MEFIDILILIGVILIFIVPSVFTCWVLCKLQSIEDERKDKDV